jgi:hypothetical protein
MTQGPVICFFLFGLGICISSKIFIDLGINVVYNIGMKMKNPFKRKKIPKERVLYAITDGDYMGSCVIFIKPKEHPKNGVYAAMAIGDKNMDGGMESMDIPEKDVISGLDLGILEKIRGVPKELYDLCCSEYIEREKRKKENNESTN